MDPKKEQKGYRPTKPKNVVRAAPEDLKKKYETVPEDKLTAMKEARAPAPSSAAVRPASAAPATITEPVATALKDTTKPPAKAVSTKPKAAPKPAPKPAPVPKAPPPVAETSSDAKKRGSRFRAAVEEYYPDPNPEKYGGIESERYEEKALRVEEKRMELESKKEADPTLKTYEQAQKDNEEKGHYALDTQIFIPITRRAFYPFIRETYADIFGLDVKTGDEKVDKEACEKLMKAGQQSVEAFVYQKFVKEYIRQASPYRGVLVYHGLGSGKTCTSIAAAEALYGVANKKIVVMTPFSLRANFLRELTFCGFRHYSLNNHWVKVPLIVRKLVKDETGKLIQSMGVKKHLELYAKSVLSLSDGFFDRLVANKSPLWIPDFKLPPNYNDSAQITQADRDQIRAQINETINNRITFINYNGVGKKKLREWACEARTKGKTIFDDSVIVIDEIHNLIRLMQGAIIPFLQEKPGATRRRKIKAEPITPGRWLPVLCPTEEEDEDIDATKEQEKAAEEAEAVETEGAASKPATATAPAKEEMPNYNRAFLFYRLLVGAKNSKIIGLTGTPITNFPEEIAILANVLGGYMDSFEFVVTGLASGRIPELKALLDKDPRTDLIQVSQKEKGMSVLCTIFQEGYVKVMDETGKFQGVKQDDTAQEKIEDIFARLKSQASSVGITFGEPKYKSYPRLPPDGDEFRPYFVNTATNDIINETLLQKRLTGLISYYKGSKKEFMPRVTEDEVIQCEMSEYMLSKYVEARQAEMKKEEGKKGEPEDIYAIVEMFAKSRNPSSYRFRSRAVCNFVFPDGITRPFPDSLKKMEQEVKEPEDLDIVDRQTEGLQDATEEERAALEAAIEQDRAAAGQQEDDDAKSRAELEQEAAPAETAAPAATSLAEAAADAAESVAEAVQDAVTGVTKQEAKTYEDLLREAMAKLSENKDKYLTLDGPTQEQRLAYYSPKLDKILRKIDESPGPALVYSQFVTVEGLGVLRLSLQANGYDEIRLTDAARASDIGFTPESEASIRKGPGAKRFVTFSGEGTRDQRAVALNIFNGKFADLPRKIADVFAQTDEKIADKTKTYQALQNRHGEICKVIGISGAGAEGISLKCVRQVHIMEPFWNMVRLDQVKGRAIRICSHAELPDEEREVSIFTYVAYFTEAQIKPSAVEAAGPKVDFTLLQRDKNETSDQKVYNVADRKDKINEGLLKVMKSTAVDCLMNLPDNEETEPDKIYTCFTTAETDLTKPMYLPDIAQDKIETDTNKAAKDAAEKVLVGEESEAESAARQTARLIRPKDTVVKDTITLIDRRSGTEVKYSIDIKDAASRRYYFFSMKDPLQERALGEMTKDPLRDGYIDIQVYPGPKKIR
jgi:hypothetical protein